MRNSTKSIISRSISGFLAFLTVFTLMASLSLIPTFAADESSETDRLFKDIWTDYYTNPEYDPETKGDSNMTTADFTTEQKRLAAMTKQYESGDFQLYADEITGEVALLDTSTGDILFTNPYDIAEYSLNRTTGANSLPDTMKQKLLSQVTIDYTSNNTGDTYYSFTDAALLDQIEITRLRGGVRVEYSIGEEETRMLIPRVMTVERWEEMILAQLEENIPVAEGEVFDLYSNPIAGRIIAYYDTYYRSKYADDYYKNYREELYALYPSFRDEDIVVFDESASYRQKKLVERYIKTYCPKYTFEELDKDHRDNQYTSKDKAPANFKMALEYYITENGLEVRFPANGLTFDESNYQLSAIKILPYMGAGSNDYNGYLFIPDGSGALVRFEDVDTYDSISGSVYGEDYAYQEIGNANREVFRMPVFGVVTTNTPQDDTTLDQPYYQYDIVDDKGVVIDTVVGPSKTAKQYSTGYFAIVTEGDALTKIMTEAGGSQDHHFNSVYCSFNPRPKDSYNLSDAISVGGDGNVTVVSKRKYTGSFRINYIMLTDPENDGTANGKGRTAGRTYYDTTYVGMAKAYRDYLDSESGGNVIDRLTAEEVKADIPLYIEAFGVTETDESFFSIPVTVKKSMTSFDNLKTMVDELAAAKVTNVNFRLTGYTNGGMISTVPTKVKFEKAVGGNDGFTDFLKYAAEKGIGVYPEFDFSYMSDSAWFDGFSYSTDAVKTIDNRYITKREYNAVLQSFDTSGKICISPCVFREYFEKFNKSMTKVLDGNVTGISLGTLGSDLNSDFDEDDPYNREDAKTFASEMLGQFVTGTNYKDIMIDAGNAYAIKYASVVLNAPLDSSRYENASESIPFFGMVYHGYLVFAGAPTNMAGDIQYEMLKILENGATLYMMLSYENVELLKEDEYLSRYYAISYEIWKETLLSKYDEAGNLVSLGLYDKLNNALKGVQTSLIDDHQFIDCVRQLTSTELENIKVDAKADYDEVYNTYNDKYMYYVSLIEQYDRLNTVDFMAKLVEAGVDAELEEIYSDEEEIAALKAEGALAVLDAVLEAVAEDAEKTAKYEALKTSFETTLSNYGISDRAYLEGERDGYAALRDSLKLQDYIDAVTATYWENRQITDGSVVYIKYDNGTYFVLNYNSFTVELDINGQHYVIAPKDFVQGAVTAA